ncbi:BatA domain-containing protein [Planctomycetota bacterium]|nr:BatA domain-containing protein [Planctomycetota bacterium]
MPTWLIWTLGIGVPLTAAAVPIIIHLINLTRYRKVDWAAMEFLLKAFQKTRRRMQLESIIMLLLRVAAVLLLAMALFPMGCERAKAWADDALGLGGSVLSSDAPLHLVIVMDNSASMGYEVERITSFERGRQYANTLIDGLTPNRDRVSIIRLSDVYVPPGLGGVAQTDDAVKESRKRRIGQAAGLNIDAARRELAATQVTAVDTNMLAAFREAARAVSSTPEGDAAALVVISDFMNSGWADFRKDGSAHTDFLAATERINGRLKSSGNTMLFYDAGYEKTSNVGITDVMCTERVIGNDMPATVLVDLSYYAHGITQAKSVRLSYRIDKGSERPFGGAISLRPNMPVDPVQLNLRPKELKLTGNELKIGASRNIEIIVSDKEGLKIDNSRNLVIHVVPDIPILVVNGHPASDPRFDETLYLESALGIHDNRIAEDRSSNEIVRITPNRIDTIKAQQLASKSNFLDYRLVILCNVSSIPGATIKKLKEYVEAGFGLMIFDGNNVDHKKYNATLYEDGEGLLPVKLSEAGGSNDENANGYSLAVAAESRNHDILKIFTADEELESTISQPKAVRNWRNVTLPEGKEADPLRPSRTILNIAGPNGAKPFMVERTYGLGNVLYVSSTASERWNSLWNYGLPLFLYLEAASYMTGNEVRYSNLAVGEPFRRILRVTDIAPKYSVSDPSGIDAEIAATAEEGISLLEFGGTAQTGVYTVTASERKEDETLKTKWEERFAVNLEARESNMVRLHGDADEADATKGPEAVLKEALGEENPFLFQAAGDELENGDGLVGDDSGGLWMWLAILGASFLLMETVWSAVVSKPEE